MKTRVLYKPLCAAALVFMFGSCIDEDNLPPCENILRVIYDYNMDREDLFHRQASDLNVYVFDSSTGLFVQEIECPDGPYGEDSNDFAVAIPASLNNKAYDYVVWSGLGSNQYNYPQLQPGVSTKDDLTVQVKGHEERLVAHELQPLWNGLKENVVMPGTGSNTLTIPLIKDTNKFRIELRFLNENGEAYYPDPEELEVGIYFAGSWYAYNNSVLNHKENHVVEYASYDESTDTENECLVFELNTLRLMADRENKLELRHIESGEVIFEDSLNDWFDELRMEYSWIETLQEYLDREDDYRIVITLTKKENSWVSVRIEINEWVIRRIEY